jgi:hypothetical protein
MPTIAIIGPYRFFFYASDFVEPVHVHVRKDRAAAKFWLNPVILQRSKGFHDSELVKIQKIVEENSENFEGKWYEYFGDSA